MAPIDLNMKFVIIGDGAVGKTSLLYTFFHKGFPTEYVPTVMDEFKVDMPFGQKSVKLSVWDTAGQENFTELRELSYPGTDMFLVCYSCVGRASFNNVKPVWMKEVKKYVNVQYILVGTKSDLIAKTRDEEGAHAVVEIKEAERLKERLEATASYQCSALLNNGVEECFKRAVKAIYDKRALEQRHDVCCTLF